MASSSSPDLLQAHVELWNLTYSYLKSMAVQCAVELGILDAVHRAGGAASLPDVLAAVPVPEHRKPHLPRLMRFLVVTGILALDPPAPDDCRVYRLTPLSRLLVDDARVNGCTSLAPFVLSQTTRFHVGAALQLSDWFKGADGTAEAEMPFRMAHGTDPWEAMRRDPEVNKMFHDGLGADSRFALDFVVTKYGVVFEGVGTLIDVGGGNGTSARTIARAFPHVKCSVLDLPHVIGGIQPSDGVQYIAGDMMSSIPLPPTDAVLLKVRTYDSLSPV
jgi:trans-resveratrol di-O-methyltransferase